MPRRPAGGTIYCGDLRTPSEATGRLPARGADGPRQGNGTMDVKSRGTGLTVSPARAVLPDVVAAAPHESLIVLDPSLRVLHARDRWSAAVTPGAVQAAIDDVVPS